ncbi:MAG: hypothetical protein ACRDTF_03480 [Pseudonocardiaceae bacterium]
MSLLERERAQETLLAMVRGAGGDAGAGRANLAKILPVPAGT